jgi:hypothetical protein
VITRSDCIAQSHKPYYFAAALGQPDQEFPQLKADLPVFARLVLFAGDTVELVFSLT